MNTTTATTTTTTTTFTDAQGWEMVMYLRETAKDNQYKGSYAIECLIRAEVLQEILESITLQGLSKGISFGESAVLWAESFKATLWISTRMTAARSSNVLVDAIQDVKNQEKHRIAKALLG